MTATTQETTTAPGDPAALDPAAVGQEDEAEAERTPRLGSIVIKSHDGGSFVSWTLGTSAAIYGLTVSGIAAAAVATGNFISGLSGYERAAILAAPGLTQVRIAQHEWSVPMLPHLISQIEDMMLTVLDVDGVLNAPREPEIDEQDTAEETAE